MASKDLDATIAKLDKAIVKPVYSSSMDSGKKTKPADTRALNELARSIRYIIKNSKDAKPQHST